MARELLTNDAITSVVGTLTDSVTSLIVSSATNFPTTGDFTIIVDTEIMYVTGVAGTVFTVVRGHEGSSNVGHADGAILAHIITAGSLARYIRDTVPMFADTDQPLLNTMVTAAAVELAATDFTAVNQGASALADYDSGGVSLYIPAAGSDNVRIYKRTAPSTPFMVTGMLRGFLPATGGGMFGLGFRESSTGKLLTIVQDGGGTATGQKWTNPTTYSSVAGTAYTSFGGSVWFQIEDTGTDLNLYISHDGVNWTQTFTEGRTVFMAGGPDEVCILGNNGTANVDFYASAHNWIEE
jgi:hypothetical protein